jgi:hypothetical protein
VMAEDFDLEVLRDLRVFRSVKYEGVTVRMRLCVCMYVYVRVASARTIGRI